MAAGRYPKRTRSQIKYCELDPEESEGESEDDGDECPPPSKRVKVSHSSKPRSKNKIFPFMDLPAELRNKIYHECLVSEQLDDQGRPSFYFAASRRRYKYTVTRCTRANLAGLKYRGYRNGLYGFHSICNPEDDASKADDGAKSLTTNLLATCKAVYNEAAPLLFQQRFIFHDSMALMNFMSGCTPQAASLIRHIEVLQWLQTRSRKNVGFLATSMLAAKGCTNLQSLVIAGSLGWFHSYSWRRPDRAREIYDRVASKVYKDFYPWLETVGIEKGNLYEGVRVLDIEDVNWRNARTGSDKDNGKAARSFKAAYEKSLKKLIRENWL